MKYHESESSTDRIKEAGQNSDVSWLVFNVFTWAHLELQLGLMCASAPALRVFFRSYLSAPINRAVHAARSAASRQSNGELNPSSIAIRRISGPDDRLSRDDFSAKAFAKESLDGTTIVEKDLGTSPHSTISSGDYYTVRTLAEYEAYNLRNMEKFRQSALERPGSRSRNFSQPFIS